MMKMTMKMMMKMMKMMEMMVKMPKLGTQDSALFKFAILAATTMYIYLGMPTYNFLTLAIFVEF
jgi:hypothetical protein